MRKEPLRIGLALSGGGMRAAVFHLGILKYLAQQHMLGSIAHISTVSGAGIGIGLVYACNHNQWPKDADFLDHVLPAVKHNITRKDIQWHALLHLLAKPYYWDKKVNLLANIMEKRWAIHGCLQDLPHNPRWTINTTAYESGKDFRISRERMGEYDASSVMYPRFLLSNAIAASAGFPVLIGPYKLKTKLYVWTDPHLVVTVRPKDRILHLWDGGVYDNLGLDPLFTSKQDGGLRLDINYLIVSNASDSIAHKTRRYSFSIENVKRLLDINMHQVNVLRTQEVLDFFQRYHRGVYLQIGTRVKDIVDHADLFQFEKEERIHAGMRDEEVQHVAQYKTSLEKLSSADFDRILRHGYETADTTLSYFGNVGGV